MREKRKVDKQPTSFEQKDRKFGVILNAKMTKNEIWI